MKALPYHGDEFLIEASPIELRFETGDDGRIQTLHCHGNVDNEPIVETVWNKVK